jgi:hypothetical protein
MDCGIRIDKIAECFLFDDEINVYDYKCAVALFRDRQKQHDLSSYPFCALCSFVVKKIPHDHEAT